MARIKKQELITHYDTEIFNRFLDTTVVEYQREGLEVELEYGCAYVSDPKIASMKYTVLVIGREKEE